jgi:glutamate dehydrogenase
MGVNFVERLQRETGTTIEFIIRTYIIVENLFDMTSMWHRIEALDTKIPAAIQHKMMLQIYLLIRRATRWFLRNRKSDINIEETIDSFKKPIQELVLHLPTLLTETDYDLLQQDIKNLVIEGVPEDLARSTCNCEILFTSLDIVEAAMQNNFNIGDIAKIYYALDSNLELNWLRAQMNSYIIDNQWDELARSGFRDDLDRAQRKLSISVLKSKAKRTSDKTIEQRIDAWMNRNKDLITRWQNLLADIKSSTNVQFVTYSVVLRELFDFASAG